MTEPHDWPPEQSAEGALRPWHATAAGYLAVLFEDPAEAERAQRGLPASAPRIEAATRAAARHGLAGPGLDPWTGATVAQRLLLDRLLGHVWAALARSGDDQQIAALVDRLDQHGTGADRQRALRASTASAGELATALARATLAGCAAPVGR